MMATKKRQCSAEIVRHLLKHTIVHERLRITDASGQNGPIDGDGAGGGAGGGSGGSGTPQHLKASVQLHRDLNSV